MRDDDTAVAAPLAVLQVALALEVGAPQAVAPHSARARVVTGTAGPTCTRDKTAWRSDCHRHCLTVTGTV